MQGTTLITENKAPVFQIKPSVSLLFNILSSTFITRLFPDDKDILPEISFQI